MLLHNRLARVGYEADKISAAQLTGLTRSIDEAKAQSRVSAVALSGVVSDARKIKDDDEIGLIRHAVLVAEQAFTRAKEQLCVGQMETHVAGLLDFAMASQAYPSSFPTIAATGPNSAFIHPKPTERRIDNDSALMLDWGAKVNGYCSDLTRTVFFGRPAPKMERAYKAILEARDEAVAFIRPGVMAKEVVRVVVDVLAKHGHKLAHGVGHGIGLDIHEYPHLDAWSTDEELQPNMVVTIEPAVYFSGYGGVRIEDDLLITPAGNEVLSTLDRSFEGNRIVR
jgi:Xaa-Pro aminopeptidase